MDKLEDLRVTVVWSVYHDEVSCAFANGRRIDELTYGNLTVLQRYLSGLRGEGWKLISGLYSGQGAETFRFTRTTD